MKTTWVQLDLAVLRENLRQARRVLDKGTEIICVVKSNAYGHGMLPVSTCAWREGMRWFAVAHIEPAVELRACLPDASILVLAVIDPEDVPVAIERRIVPVVVSLRHGRALAAAARSRGGVLTCHAKIDTGMGRLGLPCEGAPEMLATLAREGGLNIAGICSHFASAAAGRREFADGQAGRFRACLRECERRGLPRGFVHIANSGGFLCEPGWDHDGVRLGIYLYGYADRTAPRALSRPFLEWRAHVVLVKTVPRGFPVSYDSTYLAPGDTTIATVNVGYADGYPRSLSNRGEVLLGGRRCRVAGRVTMNLLTVDAGPGAAVAEGDEVVLLGAQGAESVWADEIASQCGTIPYEILTGISPAIERRVME